MKIIEVLYIIIKSVSLWNNKHTWHERPAMFVLRVSLAASDTYLYTNRFY